MPNFQEYYRAQSRRSRKDAAVTVQRRGLISFNPAAMAALGSPEGVVFLVDMDERMLGFRSAHTLRRAGRKAAPIRRPGNLVSATHVLRHLGADLSESRRFPLAVLDGTLCIDLKQPGEVVTSNRRKPRPDPTAAGDHDTTIGTGSGPSAGAAAARR
jgi:hypothetical protein